ncbi:tetratricopeptide repeat protein [Halomonas sp.]|uniref:tetratricopeptide repeat protein n=1 Tax=Halomonas sp. TaxID=1486246 RepID=UPI0026359324|nr:tetratricopeptide repeat protein [Halomonas sp.]
MATHSQDKQAPAAQKTARKKAVENPRQQVRRALAEGDLPRAERLAGRALREGPTHPVLYRLWIQATQQQGKLAPALNRARQALAAHPDDAALHQLHARLLANAGRPGTALKRLKEAQAQFPEHLGLHLLRFNLLNEMGRTLPALKALRQLRQKDFDNPGVLLAAARFYRSHGRLGAARAVLERLLAIKPEHRQARLMRLDLAREATAGAAESPLPALLARAHELTELTADDAAELLHAIKFTTDPALNASAKEALELLLPLSERLAEGDNLALFNQAVRLGHSEAARRALDTLFNNGPRKPPVARALFTQAMQSLPPHQAEAVAERLLRHIPQAQRPALQAQFAQHTEGGQAALDRLRTLHNKRKRPLPEAHQLANQLRGAAHYRLGIRYVRFCRRRWPADHRLKLLHARLLLDAGEATEALELLDADWPVALRHPALRLRAQVLIETGQLEETRAELDRVQARLHNSGLVDLYLRVLIMQGDEAAVTQLLEEAQRRGQHKKLASGHLAPTVEGNLVADLSLLNRERRALPPGDHEAALAARYINAASPVIRQHLELTPSLEGEPLIPRRVFQYWDQPTPPDAVTALMRSWQDRPALDYQRFDVNEARAFLHDTFGPAYERAFRRASNVAEASDLLRLCYLRHYGGLYADADDRLHGRIEALLPGDVGLVCFREPFDILANNVIACVPGHPAITLAAELAVEAMLGHDSESTWSKTGPGLLTRAVAHHLLSADQSAPQQRVAILPGYLLRQHVQIHTPLPHKKTQAYWNAPPGTPGSFDMGPWLLEPG